jgi:hypothetical protein
MTTDTTMELDDLKQAWHTLDRRLQQQNTLALQACRDRQGEKARRGLRPLVWGQVAQMLLLGLPFVLLAGSLWVVTGSMSQPLAWTTLVAGIFVHAYGVSTIILAGCTIGLAKAIDYAAPVLTIQKQLAKLRRLYIFNGRVAGLPWWFLWVPVLMVLTGLGGVDLYAHAPSVVWIGLGIGATGLLGTWWFHRWSRQSGRAQLGKRLDDALAGGSIRRAQQALDEIARFEQE